MWPILDHLLRHYGYAAVFLFMVAEGCGIPLPAETMLVSAAAFTSRDTLSLWGVARRGLWAAFLSRFIAFLRLAIPMLAGVTHMPFARFSAATAVGAVLSACCIAC